MTFPALPNDGTYPWGDQVRTWAAAVEAAAGDIVAAPADYTGRPGIPGAGTDARAAIQAALTAASSLTDTGYYGYLTRRSQTVRLAPGHYVITAPASGPSLTVPAGVTFDASDATMHFDYPATATPTWCGIKVEQYGQLQVGKLFQSGRVAAPDAAHVYDAVRLVATDNHSAITGYKDSEIRSFQGAGIRTVGAWISYIKGLRIAECAYGIIHSAMGTAFGYVDSGGVLPVDRRPTDLWVDDVHISNCPHGGIVAGFSGDTGSVNEPDFGALGGVVRISSTVIENVADFAVEVYSASSVKIVDSHIEECGHTDGVIRLDAVRVAIIDNVVWNFEGRLIKQKTGADAAVFPSDFIKAPSLQTLSIEGLYVLNSYNAALRFTNDTVSRWLVRGIYIDGSGYPFAAGSIATPPGALVGDTLVGCKVKRTANQMIPTSATTAVAFTAESWDTAGFHDNATNNTRLTVPVGYGGKYRLEAGVVFAPNATGRRTVIARINGEGSIVRDSRMATAGDTSMSLNVPAALAAGDYVELYVFHEAGTDVALDVATQGEGGAWMSLQRIGN